MTSSIYDGIAVGDVVGIGDKDHNYCEGRVRLLDNGAEMAIEALGALIPFARRNTNKTWVALAGVRLVSHQPPLDLGLMA